MQAIESTSCVKDVVVPRQKSIYTSTKKTAPLNTSATPFVDSQKPSNCNYPAPTQFQLPVHSRIWSSIAAKPPPFNIVQTRNELTHSEGTKHYNSFSSSFNRNGVNSSFVMDNSHGDFSYQRGYEEAFGYPMNMRTFGPKATSDGIIEIRLREGIKVLITIDRGVLIHNQNNNIKIALSSNYTGTALDHPNGRVLQQLQRVDIVAYDGMKKNHYVRYAKMWHKGISLTSEGCALIYLVDSAGTRTTSDGIQIDTRSDYCSQVFLNGSRVGMNYHSEAVDIIQNYRFWIQEDGTENFEINGMRVTQTSDGLVKVSRSNNRCVLRTSPSNGNATITTPFYHCTASLGSTSHLFVRREERRMHFDGASFVVRNAGHSAGFDDKNRLKVY